MAINDVSKYLKFANVQMAAEALYGLTPSNAGLASELQAYTTKVLTDGNDRQLQGESQIVLRGAHMNEKSDSMEKKSTPTPGAHAMEKKSTPPPGARYRKRTRTKSGGISWRTYGKSNTPIGGCLRAKVAGSACGMASFGAGELRLRQSFVGTQTELRQ